MSPLWAELMDREKGRRCTRIFRQWSTFLLKKCRRKIQSNEKENCFTQWNGNVFFYLQLFFFTPNKSRTFIHLRSCAADTRPQSFFLSFFFLLFLPLQLYCIRTFQGDSETSNQPWLSCDCLRNVKKKKKRKRDDNNNIFWYGLIYRFMCSIDFMIYIYIF